MANNMAAEDSLNVVDTHDLPQLYAKPSASTLLEKLRALKQAPLSLSSGRQNHDRALGQTSAPGIPRYLTSIVSSPLNWIRDEDSREQVWAAASARLSERSGRTAMPSMIRTFDIPVSESQNVRLQLYEPSLINDNTGFKTWTSSFLLSRRLCSMQKYLPRPGLRVLELGSGTGLVGMAAACVWGAKVTLTDLPEVLPNLESNIDNNRKLIGACRGGVCALPLDWSDSSRVPTNDRDRYSVILAADIVYSPSHPQMLVNTVQRWMRRSCQACFIVELPLRDGYHRELEELKTRLEGIGLKITEEGRECGLDDWQGQWGEQVQVECWWALFRLP